MRSTSALNAGRCSLPRARNEAADASQFLRVASIEESASVAEDAVMSLLTLLTKLHRSPNRSACNVSSACVYTRNRAQSER